VAFALTLILLVACGGLANQAGAPTAAPARVGELPSPGTAPTPTSELPSPTTAPAESTLPAGVRVAGVAVGGMTLDAARRALADALAPLTQPLTVTAGATTKTLTPAEIGLELPVEHLVQQARTASNGNSLPLVITYDQTRLRAWLAELATEIDGRTGATVAQSDKGPYFIAGGPRLDIDAALKQIDERLRTPGAPRTLELRLANGAAARPTPQQLVEQLGALEKDWNGVAGVYVYDLALDKPVAGLHENTVFSAMSVIKVAIMLHAYAEVEAFTSDQQRWLDDMIVDSDNWAANAILATSVGENTPNQAARGALHMSAMLKDLGLQHTYQRSPFLTGGYPGDFTGLTIVSGPDQEGEPPFTAAIPLLRTTPKEISQVFLWIEQCRNGTGPLIERYKKTLTPERCGLMLERLERNTDTTRMVAGLPKGTRVAHKSGWIEDAQADVGIVRSPGGDYIVAVFVYRSEQDFDEEKAKATIAAFNHLIYSYFNPEPAR
jgi:beta-lactamase class A